jgi:hypothetical protein
MAIAAHACRIRCCSSLFEACEAKLPNSESVEEMTHLSRTAFDEKQSTLRKVRQRDSYYKEQPAGLQDHTWLAS